MKYHSTILMNIVFAAVVSLIDSVSLHIYNVIFVEFLL